MQNTVVDSYRQVTRFTEISTQVWIIEQLKWDLDFLFASVKSMLIHPIDAGKQRVKYDRSKSKIFHAFNTTVEQILKYEKLAPFLAQGILPLCTSPQDRAVLSCDHHALLFASFVRYLGIPVRVRTGFAKYIVRGMLIPHWIPEVYDTQWNTWQLVDPERRIKRVDRDAFLLAGEAWDYFDAHPGVRIPGYSGLQGKQGLKYALICDLNCIFKNELLGYEWRLKTFHKCKPEIVRASFEKLSVDQQQDIRCLAHLSTDPDTNIEELRRIYQKHIQEPDPA